MTSDVIVCSIPSVKWDFGSSYQQKRILIKFCIRWSVIAYQRVIYNLLILFIVQCIKLYFTDRTFQ